MLWWILWGLQLASASVDIGVLSKWAGAVLVLWLLWTLYAKVREAMAKVAQYWEYFIAAAFLALVVLATMVTFGYCHEQPEQCTAAYHRAHTAAADVSTFLATDVPRYVSQLIDKVSNEKGEAGSNPPQ